MIETKEWQKHKGIFLDSVNGFDVIECEICEFKHIVPIPTLAELETVYRQEYYTIEKPIYLERHKEDLDWWNLVYSERYDTFEEILSPDRRRILDIGSGPGFFLLHGKQRGWETLGIEPSAQAAAHSRELGLEILEEFLTEETAQQLGTFNVVHMNEILEHVPDPKGMMHIVAKLLNPSGLICVVVPNDYNPFQQALRTACAFKPWWVAPPHHINYFDFDSIGKLLKKQGFEIILQEATFPIDMFLLMGDNYIDNDALGRVCHAKRKTLEQCLVKADMRMLKRNWYSAMAEIGIGREAVVIGKVKDNNDKTV